jgi:hypothetical protein
LIKSVFPLWTNSVALTSDGWVDAAGNGYLSLIAHFFNCLSGEIEFRVLGLIHIKESMTAEVQQHHIQDLLTELFGNVTDFSITTITTDNASVMKAMARILGMNHIGCFAHSLQLSLKNHLSGKKGVFCNLVTKVLY